MNIILKKASSRDLDFIFKIKTEKLSKKFAINKKDIKYSDHKVWFLDYLKSTQNKFYIAFLDSKRSNKVGYVRFDFLSFYYEVSICLASKYRNKGLSSNILESSENKINKSNLLIAKVLKSNFSSKKLFERSEYVLISEKNKILTYAKILNSKKDYTKNYLKIIDEIESVRTKNNVNWMDILRIAFKESPKNASKIFKNISNHDNKISKLSKKL